MAPNRYTVEPLQEQGIRSAWLVHVLESCQRVCARLPGCERNEARDLLRLLTSNLPGPSNQAEGLLLRGLVLEVAVRASATQHGRSHTNASDRCGLKVEGLLDDLALAPLDAVLSHFESWQRAFFSALDFAHPSTLGSSIGLLVRRDFRERWNLARLARHFKTSPSTIRKAFKRKFGRSVHEYQQLARIVASLDDVRSSKIDAIALGVGYQSKKNFYSAFRRLIGRTPREYRRLPVEEASLLKTLASQQLTREARDRVGTIADHRRGDTWDGHQ